MHRRRHGINNNERHLIEMAEGTGRRGPPRRRAALSRRGIAHQGTDAHGRLVHEPIVK